MFFGLVSYKSKARAGVSVTLVTKVSAQFEGFSTETRARNVADKIAAERAGSVVVAEFATYKEAKAYRDEVFSLLNP